MSKKLKKSIIISAFLPGAVPISVSAASWESLQPYTLSAVLLCSFGALILAHFSIVKMRRYQEKLEHSEERLRLSLWGSGDELWDWNIQTGELYRSASWLHPISAQPSTKEFPPNKSLIHPQDVNRVAELLQQHLDGHSTYFEATYRLRTADNSWTWILDRGKAVAYSDDGKPSRMTGTLKSIHQLKQTEEQLQLFARCLQTISDAVVICDTDFNILEVNPAFSKITGRQREKVLQQRFELTLYPSRFMQQIRMHLAEHGQGVLGDRFGEVAGVVVQRQRLATDHADLLGLGLGALGAFLLLVRGCHVMSVRCVLRGGRDGVGGRHVIGLECRGFDPRQGAGFVGLGGPLAIFDQGRQDEVHRAFFTFLLEHQLQQRVFEEGLAHGLLAGFFGVDHFLEQFGEVHRLKVDAVVVRVQFDRRGRPLSAVLLGLGFGAGGAFLLLVRGCHGRRSVFRREGAGRSATGDLPPGMIGGQFAMLQPGQCNGP